MRSLFRLLAIYWLCGSAVAAAQSGSGELHLLVTDPSGLGSKVSVELSSEANQYQQTYVTDENGSVTVKRLPFGVYGIRIQRPGFAEFLGTLEIRSSLPVEFTAKLALEQTSTTITVQAESTLLDPHRTGTINRIGEDTIQERVSSLPGRSVVDLVNSQPGWLYEGNAVLHPRGAEYGTQFVVDGVPLTDNRSPSFGVEIDGDDVQSLSVYTGDFPAEFGRKMSGVVEVETARDTRDGFHGKFVASGGSYESLGGYLLTQYAWGKNTITATADGAMTDHYLNPPVVQNYTNRGTTLDFSLRYERDITEKDQLSLQVRHGEAHFEVPNEQVQQAAGQHQDRGIEETMGIAGYQHTFSRNVLANFHFMARDYYTNLQANLESTPIIPFQERGFAEVYVNGALSIHHGRHELKTGVEVDSTCLHERFSYVITDPSQFSPGTPLTFGPFYEEKWDLEQSAYVQDQIRLGKWTASLGLRWDHYQLLVNQNAVSPRLGVARYFDHANLVIHGSYDRVFQTPSFENILLSSSTEASYLNNQNFLQLPVRPSQGNFFEIGASKAFFDQLRLDVNAFDRRMSNFADDDLLLSTGISFPIAFRNANVYGAEAKIEVPHWGRVNGFVSYSYLVGSVSFPVTGGLFLGQEVPATLNGVGRFWDSQDQRNTVRVRFRYELTSRIWAGLGGEFGSGLPVAFDGTVADAIQQYGEQVVSRVNIPAGRLRQSLAINASLGAQVWKSDKLNVQMQADGMDLNGRLNVIDFAGLFSGNAIEAQRSFALRLTASF
jgi:outer membrane cobalamin receptor